MIFGIFFLQPNVVANTFLTHRFLMEGYPVLPCELCQNDTMTLTDLSISSTELDAVRLTKKGDLSPTLVIS